MALLLDRDITELACDKYNDDLNRIRRVAGAMPSDDAFERVSALLKAMSDPTRARILFALTKEALCVCELSTLLGMSMPSVSHHLRILSMSQILKGRKKGKFVCYDIVNDQVNQMISTLLGQDTEDALRHGRDDH